MSWLIYAKKILMAQSGTLGIPGGFHPYTYNLSDSFGGPRWYPYEYDGTFDKMILNQYRYNPQYIPIGDSRINEGTGWERIANISKKELLGADPFNIQVYAIPQGNEHTVIALLNEEDNTFRIVDQDNPFIDDIGKNMGAWELMIEPIGNVQDFQSINIWAKCTKDDNGHGIFEVNGDPAAPGFHYIYRDTPSPTPSNNRTGDTSENEWDEWRKNINYR